MLDESEYPLAAPVATPHWSENFALAAADGRTGLTFLLSIGTWHGDTSVWREKLTIVLPSGERLISRNYGRATEGSIVSASIAKYEILEPGRRMHFTFDGPVWEYGFDELMATGFAGGMAHMLTLDITFEASAPLWDMHGAHALDETGIMGAMHTEQIGRCDGRLHYRGQDILLDGAHGARDHSRGPRDMGPYRDHAWINGQFEDGRGFHLYAAHLIGRDDLALSKAVIVRDGALHPATILDVSFIGSPLDYGLAHNVVLESDGQRMEIAISRAFGSIVTSVLAPFEAQPGMMPGKQHVTIFDEGVILSCDGVAGIGFCERGVAPPGWGAD